MRNLLLAGGLVAALALPGLADAQTPQTRCERSNSTNRVAGTVVGAGIGALLGSAIAGNSSNTAGTIVGGVAGAVAGNQLSKRTEQPCPPGYYEVPAAPPPGPAAFWQSGPADVRQRIDYMEDRIRRAERDNVITRRDANQAYRDLKDIRRTEADLRRRDRGRLNRTDSDYIQARLDDVGARVNWAQARLDRRERNASGSYSDRGYYDSRGVWHAR
jgi:hypothetical protein